jgi:MYXO-CTERM domain-containing protein
LSANSAASLTGFASISTVSPVPEPLEGAMLLLGLGLLAPVVRRRHRSTK